MRCDGLAKSSVLVVLFSLTLITVGIAANGDGGDRMGNPAEARVDRRAGDRDDDRADEIQSPPSEMRALLERYDADRMLLQRSYRTPLSPAVLERMQKFYSGWQSEVEKVDFEAMHQDGRIDYILLKNTLNHELRGIELRRKEMAETAPLLPFAPAIVNLAEALRHMDDMDAAKAAATLEGLNKQIDEAKKALGSMKTSKYVANRAANETDQLRAALKDWFTFYNGYDPQFTWWTGVTYKGVDTNLESYAAQVREQIVGIKPGDKTTIVGNPIGRDALISSLRYEMIPYTPEELLVLADREYAWCEAEMKRAAREMGDGDDWHKALEQVKSDYVPPGKQPELIRDLALEAIAYVEKHELVTVPELAKESWWMEMMTPERQLVNPFFTGGDRISVSYPTDGMTFEQKMMSMRGNNIHFARATVFHELIPGHELQGFMARRYRAWRRPFDTSFYVEGWALHWEMLLWDMNFARSPQDRVGMLFWRMHRAARIMFSLNFHLGNWTPQQCVDFLVDKVGHERENATAEVRRSFAGDYSPLYQAGYLLGGLQIGSLHKALVDSGKMTERQFHDAVLQENAIPIEMIRADFMNEKLTRDYVPHWKFYGDLSGKP
jgi:uncharacterized protein (DUF885 family)